jgi:hypothetical protein
MSRSSTRREERGEDVEEKERGDVGEEERGRCGGGNANLGKQVDDRSCECVKSGR